MKISLIDNIIIFLDTLEKKLGRGCIFSTEMTISPIFLWDKQPPVSKPKAPQKAPGPRSDPADHELWGGGQNELRPNKKS